MGRPVSHDQGSLVFVARGIINTSAVRIFDEGKQLAFIRYMGTIWADNVALLEHWVVCMDAQKRAGVNGAWPQKI